MVSVQSDTDSDICFSIQATDGNHKIEFQLENFCVRQYKFPVDAVVS